MLSDDVLKKELAIGMHSQGLMEDTILEETNVDHALLTLGFVLGVLGLDADGGGTHFLIP